MPEPVEHADPIEDEPEPRLVVGLAKVGLVLRQHAWRDANTRRLSPTQAQVLVFLLRRSPARLSALARDLGVSSPTVSDAVRVLVDKGLVLKTRAGDDARALALTLTAEGRAAAEAARGWPDVLLDAADALDDHEQGVFLRGLTKMLRVLQERDAIPHQAMCPTCVYFRPYQHADDLRPHHCAFVNAPFGDRSLRLECADHQSAAPEQAAAAWRAMDEAPAQDRRRPARL